MSLLPILHISNLSIGYSSKKQTSHIVSNINCTIYKGEFISLLGSNGSGKSTFLKTISKLIPIIKGNLEINQQSINSISTENLAKEISLVLTDTLPDSNLNVFEIVALGRQPYTNWLGKLGKEDETIVIKSLQLTDTLDLKHKQIHQLSDGQKQRVMIARALAQDTPIILLDEPTAHLDIHHKLKVFELLKRISTETQKTIIISTHEVNMSLKKSDKVLLFNQQKSFFGSLKEAIQKQEIQNLFHSQNIQFDEKHHQFIF